MKKLFILLLVVTGCTNQNIDVEAVFHLPVNGNSELILLTRELKISGTMIWQLKQ